MVLLLLFVYGCVFSQGEEEEGEEEDGRTKPNDPYANLSKKEKKKLKKQVSIGLHGFRGFVRRGMKRALGAA